MAHLPTGGVSSAYVGTMPFDWISLQHRAHDEFSRRLNAVTDWDAPTPNTDWSIRDLVRHVIVEQQWVPHLLAGKTVEDAEGAIDPLGDDLLAEWARYSAEATDAWASAPRDANVHLSYDTVTVDEYLSEQVSDVTIHSWDLARATGAPEELDDQLIEATWTLFEPQRDTLAASGLFAHPVPIEDDAPLQLRLLALTGRDAR
jgi:uncharacterized protein (TIGR03086 family)